MTFKKTIAASGVQLDKDVLQPLNMLPRGSALMTTSGNLASQDIKAIIHAATGSMTTRGGIFEPTLESIGLSVTNCFSLLLANGFDRMAVPFIGGKIFAGRIGVSPHVIAEKIIRAALTDHPDLVVFVTYGPEDTGVFREIIRNDWTTYDPHKIVMEGSILDYKLHRASAIVNAANMEVQFGGGLSGVIAAATGHSFEIDREARQAIQDFWKSKPG